MIKYEILFVNQGSEKYYNIITCKREKKDEDIYLERKIDKYLSSHPGYKYDSIRIITCQACIEGIMNQEAHYDFGNCLYDPELQ